MPNKVAITNCYSYDYEEIRKSLLLLIENTDFPIVEGKTVLVKPNILSDANKDKNITTNPLVVKATISILKEKGAKTIYCGDSPGLPSSTFKGKNCGIYDICQEEGAIWADFFDRPITTDIPNGHKIPQARLLKEVDLVFSLSKMKTHQLMGATGAVKNMFGTVPGLNKSHMHLLYRSPLSFASFILCLYKTHIPEYSIMDGIISMEGAGPANGTLRQTNLLLASSSALALDKAEAIIMGYDPKDIPILFVAERQEKGSTEGIYTLLNPYDITIKDFRRVPVKKRGLISALLLPYLNRHSDRNSTKSRPVPFFDKEKCRACSKCVDICPAKALKIVEKHVEINKDKCIRCYCCHEMCPFDAIIVKKSD